MNQALPMVYLVRHGDTAWTLTAQHTGQTDLPHRREDLLQPIEGV
jgi:probable phosphoglycerate mutase